MARFEVHVVSGSSRGGADGRYGGVPRLRVTSPPTDGRANREAERRLTKLLGISVRLTGGARSRKKSFDAELAGPELRTRLANVFG